MKKKYNIKILILFFFIFLLIGYFFLNFIIGNNKFEFLNSLVNKEHKEFIKKNFFPHKHQSYQTKRDIRFIESKNDIKISKSVVKLSNNKILEKYKLNSGFYSGIYNIFPGTGYFDFYDNNIVILSARGLLVFKKIPLDNKNNFKQISNNIYDFINLNQYKKNKWFSLKDLLISNNQIYISYTEEIKEDCWNTSIIYGTINLKNIKFKKLISSKECIHSVNNVDSEFHGNQSGGRIVAFDKNHILLSVGEYRSRFLAQSKQGINGKIIKVNIHNGKFSIISMGHRNPQGLLFDKENNFILVTEHGPMGGDEINLIDIKNIDDNEILNYGWPLASSGEHYGGKIKKNFEKYKKYPLYKSHINHGFIEPLKSFVPSIGISEIIKFKKKYATASMKDKSVFFFELDNENKITNLKKLKMPERIRDIKFFNNKLYLFFEDTPSIGVINLMLEKNN
jgi:hypothetical protein